MAYIMDYKDSDVDDDDLEMNRQLVECVALVCNFLFFPRFYNRRLLQLSLYSIE